VIEFCWLDSIVNTAELLADPFEPEFADDEPEFADDELELDDDELAPQAASSVAETSTEHATAAPRFLNGLFMEVQLPL
jgi:hypothetical protein